jgi:hypothetical protein
LGVTPVIDGALLQKLRDQLSEVERDSAVVAQGVPIPVQAILVKTIKEAHEIVTELRVFQELAESPDSTPLTDILNDLIGHARDTKETLLAYMESVAIEAKKVLSFISLFKVSLPTVHYLFDSLAEGITYVPAF